ncbi:MAG TPA: geranylgeranylglyceryl/heptaprenylglyceryl phosphate synthase [Gemmatimonadaceae bacterium]|nr:geranylgeranylglyceryl/heptaprenylglyceryl phosphate synthase [Gemmatimonadaceae bacterium]
MTSHALGIERTAPTPLGGQGLALLVDPGRTEPAAAEALARGAASDGVAALLVGDSFGATSAAALVRALRRGAPELPIIQFPATAAQLVADVDAVLLLSLVSGRNAQYLIEEHVRAVPFFQANPQVAAISTAYCLVDGGHVTSVEAVSQTRPLPADKPELVAAHVAAAMLIGMRAVYLDAGSGATKPVAPALVAAARRETRGTLFVGGGIRDPRGVAAVREAGADYVVVGTAVERDGRTLAELARAAG